MADPIGRLLIVRLGSLGDLVHTVPAVAALRRAYPFAQIDWFVDQVHRPFVDLVSSVSTVVPLRQATAQGWLEARRELRRRQYEVAIDFQGLIKSAALARWSGATRVIGFNRRSARESWAALAYTERIDAAGVPHVIDKNLRLAAAAGAPTDAREFPLNAVESPVADQVRAEVGTSFALLNCGAAWPNKRWPTDRFAAIATWLRDTHALRSVVLWGPGEQSLADAIVARSAGAAVAAPATNLHDLVALSRSARVMVSGDTGPTHIAAAVGTPVIGLFGPTDPERNGPWDRADVVVSRYAACECHYERRCTREGHQWCLETIGEADVQAAITRRLEGAPA